MNKVVKYPFNQSNSIIAAILLIGAGGMVGQLLLLRVLMVVFYGNELTLGVAHTTLAALLTAEPAGILHGFLFPLSTQLLQGRGRLSSPVSRSSLIEMAGASLNISRVFNGAYASESCACSIRIQLHLLSSHTRNAG